MRDLAPTIFSPAHLKTLGLEHDPSRHNEATPFPHAHDPIANTSVFFNPAGCMVSFRMLERALARLGVDAQIHRKNGATSVNMTLLGQIESTYSTTQDVDMIECYVGAAIIALEKTVRQPALASP